MKTTIKLATAALLGALAIAPANSARAADCGTAETVTIAEFSWLSAGALAYITQKIMSAGYGCDAQIIPGDTVPTATSMLTKTEPDVAPELWISTAQEIWAQIQEKGTVYKASDVFASGGEEGWWIPDYIAAAHPEIKTVEDLKANWAVFADASNPEKGRLYGCPPGWACEIITGNLFNAMSMGETWELFPSGSGETLKAAIAKAVTRKEAFVGYYWGPTDVIGKYKLVKLGMPEFDADKWASLGKPDSEDPQLTGWPVGEVAVAVATTMKERAPDVADFLGKMQVPNAEISTVLAWADDNGATTEETAIHFLKNYEAIWTQWVPADVAEKVRASL